MRILAAHTRGAGMTAKHTAVLDAYDAAVLSCFARHGSCAQVWTAAGECVAELVGHTAIVYSVAVSPDGALVATGSEDGTARVWRLDGSLQQTLEHPGATGVPYACMTDRLTACMEQ